ncbi:CopG family transcriptional regulator [Halalkalicoccus subterraneus]|nr:CopG family transcriptional regulator [Halalkalicoccus subterraneus]
MPKRYSLVCDDRLAAKIDALAKEYHLTESEVLHQLVGIGLEEREMTAR